MPNDEPVCRQCGGTGYKTVDSGGNLIPPDKILESGHVGYATACGCFGTRLGTARLERANIPHNFRRASFGTFIQKRDGDPLLSDALSQVHLRVKVWADNFNPGDSLTSRGMLLTGPPGTGKSHLAVAALRVVLEKYDGMFWDYQSLLNAVAKSWNRDGDGYGRNVLEDAVNVDVLLIDDLGAHRLLEWTEDIITNLITARYNAGRAVIITTNLSLKPAELKRDDGHLPRMSRSIGEVVGTRTASRLLEMCRIESTGSLKDYREQIAQRR